MQELPHAPTSNTAEEVLISREITFRNSTFGALKTFIRAHNRRTGVTLTNDSAVDMILRAYLPRDIHPDAVKTMHRLSHPQAVAYLQTRPQEPSVAPLGASVAAQPVVSKPTSRMIQVELTRNRPFVDAVRTKGATP